MNTGREDAGREDAGRVVEILREAWADPAVPLPDYASMGAAGADLRANFGTADRAPDHGIVGGPNSAAEPDTAPRAALRDGGVTIAPGARALIPTGLRVAIPPGYEMQLRPRSGLALKHGITLLNSPGTIDADYRGPLGVILINLGEAPFFVAHGARIAQAITAPAPQVRFREVSALDATARGAGGFGSTGAG